MAKLSWISVCKESIVEGLTHIECILAILFLIVIFFQNPAVCSVLYVVLDCWLLMFLANSSRVVAYSTLWEKPKNHSQSAWNFCRPCRELEGTNVSFRLVRQQPMPAWHKFLDSLELQVWSGFQKNDNQGFYSVVGDGWLISKCQEGCNNTPHVG